MARPAMLSSPLRPRQAADLLISTTAARPCAAVVIRLPNIAGPRISPSVFPQQSKDSWDPDNAPNPMRTRRPWRTELTLADAHHGTACPNRRSDLRALCRCPRRYWTRFRRRTNMDVSERLDTSNLVQNAIIVAAFFYHAANREEPLPRKPLPAPDVRWAFPQLPRR